MIKLLLLLLFLLFLKNRYPVRVVDIYDDVVDVSLPDGLLEEELLGSLHPDHP